MATRRTRADLLAENRMLRREHRTQGVVSVLTTAIWAMAVVLVARYSYLTVDTLAGDRTVADIGIRVLGDIRISAILPMAVGFGGILYGYRQRSLRKSAIERLASRNRNLERRTDPGRTSSGLTSRGDTPS